MIEVLHPTPKEPEVPILSEEELEVTPPPEPVSESGLTSPVEVDAIPTGRKIPRDEVTLSSLGVVPPDPRTIVDASNVQGFRPSSVIK